jgi:hypothetical protein
MAEVRIDRSSVNPIIRSIRDDDVGAGEPTWVVPATDGPRWLSFPDARDQTVLLRVESLGKTGLPLRLGPELEGASALAAQGEQLLFAVPRGRAIELFPATCKVPERALEGLADAGVGSVRVELGDAGPPPAGTVRF